MDAPQQPVDEMRERLKKTSNILAKLSEDPEAIAEVIAAINSLDKTRYMAALDRIGLASPTSDEDCITITQTITALIPGEWTFEEVCRPLSTITGLLSPDTVQNLSNATTSQELLAILRGSRRIACEWVLVRKGDRVITASIAKTICGVSDRPRT